MSDVTFRSQQAVDENRRFYDAQRYQGNQQTVSVLGDVANQVVGGMRDQAALQMQEQRMQREMAMQEADLGMRLQIGQQEMALNQEKILMAQSIDQMDMGRMQVQAMKLQNEAAELQLKEAKRKFDDYGKDSAAARIRAVMSGMDDAPALWAQGYVFNPETLQIEADEKRAESASTRYREMGGRGTSTNQDRLMVESLLRQFGDEGSESFDPEIKSVLQRKLLAMSSDKDISALAGKPKTPRVDQPKKLTSSDNMVVDSWTSQIVNSSKWAGGGIPEDRAQQIATTIYQQRDAIARELRAGAVSGRQVQGEDADIVRDAMSAFLRPQQTPAKFAVLATLVRSKVLTAEEADFQWRQVN